jgi:hypothetical protein
MAGQIVHIEIPADDTAGSQTFDVDDIKAGVARQRVRPLADRRIRRLSREDPAGGAHMVRRRPLCR